MRAHTHTYTLPFVHLHERPHMQMCVPADLLSLKDGTIKGGGGVGGSAEGEPGAG